VPATPEELRGSIRALVRRLGVLNTDRTPAGIPLGVSYCHAVSALMETPEPLRQRDLAEVLNLNKSSVTRLCRRLEEDGHLEISADADDGRARSLTLTASGRELGEQIHVASRDRYAALLAIIPKAEHENVLRSLDVLNAALATLDAD